MVHFFSINDKERIMEQSHASFFHSIDQFRALKEDTLDTNKLIEVILNNAQQPGADLKSFLSRTVLCNHGTISSLEIRDLALKLFKGNQADEVLRSLSRDKCLGYTAEEIAGIRLTLQSPEASNYCSTAVQEALGCKIVKNLFGR
jgi:predicted RNA-binding Zn ribbon-like protein